VVAQGARGASPALPPAVTAPNVAARAAAHPSAAPNPSAAARASAIGGPHTQGLGRVGGPAIGRPAHAATIDGTQLHHKL
jgi:hypothetical protein